MEGDGVHAQLSDPVHRQVSLLCPEPTCGFPLLLTTGCNCSNCLADGVELQKKHKPVTVSYQGYTVVNGVMFVCLCL